MKTTKSAGSVDKGIRIVLVFILLVFGLFAPVGGGLKTASFVLAGERFSPESLA
jgi:hypothetical protein